MESQIMDLQAIGTALNQSTEKLQANTRLYAINCCLALAARLEQQDKADEIWLLLVQFLITAVMLIGAIARQSLHWGNRLFQWLWVKLAPIAQKQWSRFRQIQFTTLKANIVQTLDKVRINKPVQPWMRPNLKFTQPNFLLLKQWVQSQFKPQNTNSSPSESITGTSTKLQQSEPPIAP